MTNKAIFRSFLTAPLAPVFDCLLYPRSAGAPVFHEARAPSVAELEALLNRVIQRIVKLLTRTGYLIEEQGMSYLAEADSDRALAPFYPKI